MRENLITAGLITLLIALTIGVALFISAITGVLFWPILAALAICGALGFFVGSL